MSQLTSEWRENLQLVIASAITGVCTVRVNPGVDSDESLDGSEDWYLRGSGNEEREMDFHLLNLALKRGAELSRDDRLLLYRFRKEWPEGAIVNLINYSRIPGEERLQKSRAQEEEDERWVREDERRRLELQAERSSFGRQLGEGKRIRAAGYERRVHVRQNKRPDECDRRMDRKIRQRRRECVICE